MILETEGNRNLIAQKVAQAVCLGNQKMVMCLSLLEPLRVRTIVTRICDHLENFTERHAGENRLSGALEQMTQKWIQDHAQEIEEKLRKLERESKLSLQSF